MKIGLPKLRLSRKLFIIALGMTLLLGGTSAAALYFSGKELGMESAEASVGGECTDIQTMVLKTPSNRLWLRRFIRMENASGPDQVRTALRIAGLLAKKNQVDLIHISVLDSRGPTLRSQMRARSIGAEVLIALKPDNLPDMKSPAMASYYEGPVSDEGRYYGDKVVVDISEIGAMMTAMRSIEEKPDCISPVSETDEAATKEGEKKKEKKEKKEKSAEGGEKEAEAPAEESKEGEKDAAKEGAEEASSEEPPAKEQSFFDSMLSMVGLGESEKATAEETPATDASNAVAEEPAEESPEGDKAASDSEIKAGEKNETSATEGHEPAAQPVNSEASTKSADTSANPEAEDADADKKAADAAIEHAKPGAKAESHDAAEKPVDGSADIQGGKPEREQASDTSPAESDEKSASTKAEHKAAEKESSPAPEVEGRAQPNKAKAAEQAEVEMPVGD